MNIGKRRLVWEGREVSGVKSLSEAAMITPVECMMKLRTGFTDRIDYLANTLLKRDKLLLPTYLRIPNYLNYIALESSA